MADYGINHRIINHRLITKMRRTGMLDGSPYCCCCCRFADACSVGVVQLLPPAAFEDNSTFSSICKSDFWVVAPGFILQDLGSEESDSYAVKGRRGIGSRVGVCIYVVLDSSKT